MKPWKALATACGILVFAFTFTLAQSGGPSGYPGPQVPYPGPSTQLPCADDPSTICVTTPQGLFPVPAPNTTTNFLPTVYSDNVSSKGTDMLNTLPSTSQVPYNLMVGGGPISVASVDPTSPTDDLTHIFQKVINAAQQNGTLDTDDIQFGINILEGNKIGNRPTYSGIALLNYTCPQEVRAVQPITKNGTVVGGNVNVHQVWFDSHIISDTCMIDPTAVQNVPWTITYKVDILDRGADDFSPYVMYFDDPPGGTGTFGKPHVAMDQTFFPMHDGTELVMQIEQAQGKYWNLVYTWGWRRHPPRVQVTENALKKASDANGLTQSLPQWETSVFGTCPQCNSTAQANAIAKIGDLSPTKRMWRDLENALVSSPSSVVPLMQDAQQALADWEDRNQLPTGVQADPNADLTLFFVNNTIYGNQFSFRKWITRPATFNITLINGDYFEHGYQNVDFGGARGWENMFQSTTADTAGGVIGGSGCWFTFGRDYWWVNAGGPWGAISVPAATPGGALPVQKVRITLNFEPTSRLRLYNFDPLHHAEAIYSLH